MPNAPALAAETGLPAIRPQLSSIMRQAHEDARALSPRLPYAERFKLALRRAWREAHELARERLRAIVEDQVECLIALLDHLDPDPDLEPSLGHYYAKQHEPDAEEDDSDDDRCDDEDGGDLEPSGGLTLGEDDADFSDVPNSTHRSTPIHRRS